MKPGDIVGNYGLLRKVGEGGMGTVWLAEARGPGGFVKRVIVKFLRGSVEETPEGLKLFEREARIAALLHHPNIVQTYAFDVTPDGIPYLVMEYVRGRTIRQLDPLWGEDPEWRPIGPWLRLFAMAAEGLQHAHDMTDETGRRLGLVHRDLSTANIMISEDGIPRILDFGVARTEHDSGMTLDGSFRGNPMYAAPEQCQGESVSPATDVFALGIQIFQVLCGRHPFAGKQPSGKAGSGVEVYATMRRILQENPHAIETLRPDAPPAVSKLLGRALRKDPEARIPNGGALREEIVAALRASGLSSDVDDARVFARRMLAAIAPPEVASDSMQGAPVSPGGSSQPVGETQPPPGNGGGGWVRGGPETTPAALARTKPLPLPRSDRTRRLRLLGFLLAAGLGAAIATRFVSRPVNPPREARPGGELPAAALSPREAPAALVASPEPTSAPMPSPPLSAEPEPANPPVESAERGGEEAPPARATARVTPEKPEGAGPAPSAARTPAKAAAREKPAVAPAGAVPVASQPPPAAANVGPEASTPEQARTATAPLPSRTHEATPTPRETAPGKPPPPEPEAVPTNRAPARPSSAPLPEKVSAYTIQEMQGVFRLIEKRLSEELQTQNLAGVTAPLQRAEADAYNPGTPILIPARKIFEWIRKEHIGGTGTAKISGMLVDLYRRGDL